MRMSSQAILTAGAVTSVAFTPARRRRLRREAVNNFHRQQMRPAEAPLTREVLLSYRTGSRLKTIPVDELRHIMPPSPLAHAGQETLGSIDVSDGSPNISAAQQVYMAQLEASASRGQQAFRWDYTSNDFRLPQLDQLQLSVDVLGWNPTDGNNNFAVTADGSYTLGAFSVSPNTNSEGTNGIHDDCFDDVDFAREVVRSYLEDVWDRDLPFDFGVFMEASQLACHLHASTFAHATFLEKDYILRHCKSFAAKINDKLLRAIVDDYRELVIQQTSSLFEMD